MANPTHEDEQRIQRIVKATAIPDKAGFDKDMPVNIAALLDGNLD